MLADRQVLYKNQVVQKTSGLVVMILKNLNRLNLAQLGNKQLPGEEKAAHQFWTCRGHIGGHVKVSGEHLKPLALTPLSALGLFSWSSCFQGSYQSDLGCLFIFLLQDPGTGLLAANIKLQAKKWASAFLTFGFFCLLLAENSLVRK